MSRLRAGTGQWVWVAMLALGLAGCGGGGGNGGGASNNSQPPANNPQPSITALAPTSATVGAAAQTLTINGTGFMSTSTVTYNGTAHTATFVSATQLTIPLTAADQATVGKYAVVVTNPAPGGGASSAFNFVVKAPAPAITGGSAPSQMAGAAAETLTLTGTGFQSGATVTFNGSARAVTFGSATSVTVALTAADLATAGTYAVVLTNPDGQVSNSINFTVNNPVPAITAVTPNAAFPCDTPETVTITGTNFNSSTTVALGQTSITPTAVTATQITFTLTRTELPAPGAYSVNVSNPAPGGGSATSAFTSSTPAGQTLSGTAAAGATLTVYAVTPAGATGAALCSTTVAGSGSFTLTLDAAQAGPIRISSSGGQLAYTGTSGATTYAETSAQTALFDSVAMPGQSNITVGLTSSLNDELAQGLLAGGKQASLTAAHAAATTLLDGYLGLSGNTAIELITAGSQDGANRLAFEQGALTEGLSVDSKSPGDIEAGLVADIYDGVWDGRSPTGGAITLGTTGTTMLATAGTSDVLDATINWINGPGKNVTPAANVAALVKGMANCSCTPAAVGFGQTNSGRETTLAFNGHQYLYVAEGSGGIVVLDVTDPTATTPPPAKVWSSITLSSTDGAQGLAGVLGNSDHPELFAFSDTQNPANVAMLNAATLATGTPGTDNPVEFQGGLSFANTGTVQTSGELTQITGAVWDGCAVGCRVLLTSIDGYTTFNPATDKVDETQLYANQDTNQQYAENFGVLVSPGIQVAGVTGLSPIIFAGNDGGIQMVDLAAKGSFYMDAATQGGTYFPNFPAGIGTNEFVDASALDSQWQVAAVAPEGGQYIGLMSLKGLTETPGVGGLGSFTPGTAGAVQIALGSGMSVEGVGVDSTNHMLLVMPSPAASNLAVGQIASPGAGWTGLSDWADYAVSTSAKASTFAIPQDPHGTLAVASLGAGNAKTRNETYGYLPDASGHGVLQIDMQGLIGLPRAGTAGDAAHTVAAASDPTTTTDSTTGGVIMSELTW